MTVSIQENKGTWRVVGRFKNPEKGYKWDSRTKTTGLKVKGNNKRKAQEIAEAYKIQWEKELLEATDKSYQPFATYMKIWLEETKDTISQDTYYEYKRVIHNTICPWFEEKKILLRDLTVYDIQEFYGFKLENGVTANTIRHYHANISKALNHAVKMELIPKNPASLVELPKKEKHQADFYSAEELKLLIEKSKGTKLETVILFGAWFGMRRGEIIGMKWKYVDFENKKIHIVGVMRDKGASGSRMLNMHYEQTAKSEKSIRSFPMTDEQCSYLKNLKSQQDFRRMINKNYNHEWDEFVCVKPDGEILPLDYVTRNFPKLCVKCGLKRLKLHELRHTNISLLLSDTNNSMKEVQEWAGHSSYNTTANIYAHVQEGAKNKLTKTIQEIISE